jgi:hypothetical protein
LASQPTVLDQIEADEPIECVIADGASDTLACHEAITDRGAMAIIPPRKNAQLWDGRSVGSGVRTDAVAACNRLGSAIWKKWSGYHRRSLAETTMHRLKRIGQRLMARTFDRQVVELHVWVYLLNRFNQIGRPHTVPVG